MPYMSNNQQQRILSELKPRLFQFIQCRATIVANQTQFVPPDHICSQRAKFCRHNGIHTMNLHGLSLGHKIDGQGPIMGHPSEGHGPSMGHPNDGYGLIIGHLALVRELDLWYDEPMKETGKPMRPWRIHTCPEFLIHEYSRQQNF